MTKYLFAMTLSFSFMFTNSALAATVIQAQNISTISGVIEHVESTENEAMVKLVGVAQLFTIKDLMSFPEEKLQMLTTSQDQRSIVKLKVDEKNQILDVSF